MPLSTSLTNSTISTDTHPAHHNALADAINNAAALSNDTPQPLGTAASGTSDEAMRSDAVFPFPPLANPVPLSGETDRYTWPIGFAGTYFADNNEGYFFCFPVIFERSLAVKLGTRYGAAGSAGAVIRFGVFADDPVLCRAAALVADLGVIDATLAPGYYQSPSSFTPLVGRRYWVGMVIQGAAVTRPTLPDGITGRGSRPAEPLKEFGGSSAFSYRDQLHTDLDVIRARVGA